MIPVALADEPADFDTKVRKKGAAWFRKKEIDLTKPLPDKTEPSAYWQGWCLQELHTAYGGICAYLCVYIESVIGGGTVDHYLGKKARPDLAYEWSNYRLACDTMNTRKGEATSVLDPFTVQPESFQLNLLSGAILATESQSSQEAEATIHCLKLDDEKCRGLRRKYYLEYRQGHISADFLRRHAPFVYQEVERQGKLRESEREW
ncbi:hypothetical protein [Armatimonas sp.]|uniref:hypothetical protein n=1 Tax=Armatimonas sp. TaxID=1872638 RepID=UPI00374D926E